MTQADEFRDRVEKEPYPTVLATSPIIGKTTQSGIIMLAFQDQSLFCTSRTASVVGNDIIDLCANLASMPSEHEAEFGAFRDYILSEVDRALTGMSKEITPP